LTIRESKQLLRKNFLGEEIEKEGRKEGLAL
jgi:hypothetical protein